MNHLVSFACFAALCSLAACGGAQPAAESPAAASAPPAAPAADAVKAPANFSEQVALGQRLYGEKCAGCHGASGQGGKAPAVVGLDKGALPLDPAPSAKFRKAQFVTVMDVAGFVVKTMPPDAPGSLSTEEYFSVLAFDLKANGIDLGDKKLDADLAKTLNIPR